MSLALTLYLAGLIASSAITYRNAVADESLFVLAAIAHLLWPLSFPVIIAWGLATTPTDDRRGWD